VTFTVAVSTRTSAMSLVCSPMLRKEIWKRANIVEVGKMVLSIVILLLLTTGINNIENMVSEDTEKNSRLFKVFMVMQRQVKKECFITCALTTTLLNGVYWLQHHDINNFIGTLGWL